MKRIYLACPYSHDNPEVSQSRYELVNMVAARLMKQGHNVFSPISHSHPIAGYMDSDLRFDLQFWMKQDLSFIDHWAESLYVLTVPGWEQSKGVQREIEYWQTVKKLPVEHIKL